MSDNAAAALKGASLAFRSSAEPRTQSPPPPLPPPPPSIFTKPKLKAKPSTSLKYGAQLTSKSLLANDGSTRDSGSMAALQAANISTGTSVLPAKSTIAGRHPARLARPELSPRRAESPGSSVATATSGMAASTVLPGVRYLYPPGATAQPDPKSPSYIAASLAANRAVSPDPSQATRRFTTATRGESVGSNSSSSTGQRRSSSMALWRDNTPSVVSLTESLSYKEKLLDTSSIGPATSLIGMFEGKKPTETSLPAVNQNKSRPKPARHSLAALPTSSQGSLDSLRSPTPRINRDVTSPALVAALHASTSSSPSRPQTPQSSRESVSQAAPTTAPKTTAQRRQRTSRPPTPPLSRNLSRPPASPSSTSSRQSSPPRASSPPHFYEHRHAFSVSSIHSSPSSHARRHHTGSNLAHSPETHNFTSTNTSAMPLNSLTDAMLASAIAAKRLTPSSTGTSSTAGLHRHSRTTPGATPGSTSTSTTTARQRSPHLLSTLRSDPRAPESDENSAERRRKKHALSKIGAKGKHRHHEGSRKRWREEVTERERKRYEALWASNRGQYLVHAPAHPALTPAAAAALVAGTTPPVHGEAQGDYSSSTATAAAAADTGAADDERDLVANVVVRELWRRSRLPAGELAEVWDLVDRQARGALNKQEFVVGMWLIDQRLRGRKIPHRVQRSVWDTAKTAWSKASSHKGQK